MHCLYRIQLTVAVISVLLILVPRVAAEDALGILPVAAEEQSDNTTAVSYGGCGRREGESGCSMRGEERKLQEAEETPNDNCNRCTKAGNLWATVDFFGQSMRRCISKIAEPWWKSELGGAVHRSCMKLTSEQRKLYTPAAVAPVPTTCDKCVKTEEPSFWCVDGLNKATGCYPQKLAKNVFCRDVRKNGSVKRHTSCTALKKTPKATQRFGTWMPVEIGTCEECVRRNYKWCATELSKTTTKFCTASECPGENGMMSSTCAGKNKEATKKLINFAENCEKCLTPELKKDFIWCSKTFYGRKINYCVPKIAAEQLCYEGNHVNDCAMITDADLKATVPVHKGGAA